MTVLGEGRTIAVTGGAWTDTFAGLQVGPPVSAVRVEKEVITVVCSLEEVRVCACT